MLASEWLKERGDNKWLATKMGVSVQTVCRWKTGVHVPRGKHMERIVKLSDGRVTPNDFYAAPRARG